KAQERFSAVQKDAPMLKEEVDEEDIAKLVSKWTGIPTGRLLEAEAEKLVHMEERLRLRVVGQDNALERVANAVRRSRAGLSDAKRPIGSFIFLGPTGVGKTELARALAEFLFDDEKLMIRIDMSEYMEKHSVSRLIGAPPGYVGYAAISELAGKDPERARKEAMEALRAAFRPEFLNRIDEIVIFNPLGKEQLAKIVSLLMKSVEKLLAERQITLELKPAAQEL